MKLSKVNVAAGLLACAGLMGLHTGVQATTVTTEHGVTCKPEGANNQAGWSNGVYGFTNVSTVAKYALCPVVRVGEASSGTGSMDVWIDGYLPASAKISCLIHSMSYTGAYLGYATAQFQQGATAGYFDIVGNLPVSLLPTYSTQVVECNVPKGGSILDVEPELH